MNRLLLDYRKEEKQKRVVLLVVGAVAGAIAWGIVFHLVWNGGRYLYWLTERLMPRV